MKSYADIVLKSSFSKDASDTSWLSSLPRATSPPPPPRVTSLKGTARGVAPDSVAPRLSSDSEDRSLHDNDRYKALLKENADLTAEISRLHDFETGKEYAYYVCIPHA